jgi:hypothetical protein
MQLQEALEQLKSGAELYRTGWNPQDGYVRLMPGMSHVWKIVLSPQPNAGNYIFSMEDLMAHDWELFSLATPRVIEAEAIEESEAA